MPSQRTAIVIGGGIVGCSAAYYLARFGWQVRLLERDRLGSGASTGNCGYICPSHVLPMAVPGAIGKTLRTMLGVDSPIAIRPNWNPALWSWLIKFASQCRTRPMMRSAQGRHALLVSSLKEYRELLLEEQIDCQWQDRGLLMVHQSARTFDSFAKTAQLLEREFSVTATPFTGEEVTRLEPALRSGLAGGWLFPKDAHLQPSQLLESLRNVMQKQGVVIEEGVTVESLRIQNKQLRSVETSQGSREADVYLFATGAEAPAFAKPLRCRIPIQPGKGYSLTLPMPTTNNSPKIPMIFEKHHVGVTPWDGMLRIGSTMEFAGYDRSLNPLRLALLMRSAREHLVEVPAEATAEKWRGWRPMIYDGLPCIDRTPGARNAIVAAGNGMIGLATGPATGKLAAEIASEREPHIDPAPYSLSRFS